MNVINIIVLSLIFILVIVGIETVIRIKKYEDKSIDLVRNSLIKRINILMILTILIGIFSIISVIIKK